MDAVKFKMCPNFVKPCQNILLTELNFIPYRNEYRGVPVLFRLYLYVKKTATLF